MALRENDLKSTEISCVKYQPELCLERISSSDVSRFRDNERLLAVKIGLIKSQYEKVNKLSAVRAYEELEEVCQISVTALKYAVSCTKGHTANRRFLYKFCVGLHMSLDEANELFELESGKLSEQCLEDLICICALRDEDSIYDFINEFEKYTESKLALRNRKTNKIKKS